MKVHACPLCGSRMKRNGTTSAGRTLVEVHLLRRELGAEDRQRGEAARGLPRLAPHAQAPGRHARRREDLQEEVRPLLGYLADAAQGRGAEEGRLRRRDPPRQEGRRADSLRRRARPGLAPVPLREQPGVVGADVAHRGARGGRLRRRGRIRQGPQGDVARDEAPEVRLPRLLAGEPLHHDEAEDGGGPGALRARQGAPWHHHPQGGGRVGRGAARLVGALGRAPRRDDPGRGRQGGSGPREAREGEALSGPPRQRRRPLHLPGPRSHPGRAAPVDQQPHRGRGERAAAGDAQGPQGGSPSSEGSRRSSGGATCTARTRCQPPRSFGSCPRTARSPQYTGGWTSGGGSREPSRDGATPWSGRSSTTRSPTGWTGTEWTHFLSYKPLSLYCGGFWMEGTRRPWSGPSMCRAISKSASCASRCGIHGAHRTRGPYRCLRRP